MTSWRLVEILNDVQTKIIYLLAPSVLCDPIAISALTEYFLAIYKNFLDALSAEMYYFCLMFLINIERSIFLT